MTPTDLGAEVRVRSATVDDAEALADLYSDARRAAVPQMPPAMHTDEEHRGYYARQLGHGGRHGLGGRESDAEPLGFALCTPTFLDGLYVRADLKGRGSARCCSTSSRRPTPTATSCGSSRATTARGGSTSGAAWSRSSAPTGRATRRSRPTSGWPGAPDRWTTYLRRSWTRSPGAGCARPRQTVARIT